MGLITGTSSSETLQGTDVEDDIRTRNGDDIVYAFAGNDLVNSTENYSYWPTTGSLVVYGGDGNDNISGSSGSDRLYGDAGNDVLSGREGNDTLEGGVGDDVLRGNDGDDTLDGGAGDDTLYGNDGDDTLNGGVGDDTIRTGNGLDVVFGGAGNDNINGNSLEDGSHNVYSYTGALQADGGEGNDFIYGSTSDDSLVGGVGDDVLRGNDGDDTLDGGDGDDLLRGYDGDDTLDGGVGDDTLYGDDGDDTLDGGAGDDVLGGDDGDDTLDGGAGDDVLWGNDGDDTLDGGDGFNELNGGDGNDTYILSTTDFYIYDSGGNDSAVVNVNFIKIPSVIETVTYAEGVKELPYWVSALLGDSANAYSNFLAPEKAFLFGFPDSTSDYSYDLSGKDLTGWRPFSESQKAATRSVLKYIESVVDIKFIETSNINQLSLMAFANNNQESSAGYASFPSNSSKEGSDLFFNIEDNGSLKIPIDGSNDADIFIHEIGHALGLKHPFDEPSTSGDIAPAPYLQGDEDNAKWTQMAYEGSIKKVAFSELDIAALHYVYGNNPEIRTGDDTYIFDPANANFIWDGAGTDTIDASTSESAVTIYLEAGMWGHKGANAADQITLAGQITVNFGTELENLTGSLYSDRLFGNDLDNFIVGGAGNDEIYGGKGDDNLDGGEGTDYTLYDDKFSDCVITIIGNNCFVQTKTQGYDTLTNIELLRFSDKTYELPVAANIAATGSATISVTAFSEASWDAFTYATVLKAETDVAAAAYALAKANSVVAIAAFNVAVAAIPFLYVYSSQETAAEEEAAIIVAKVAFLGAVAAAPVVAATIDDASVSAAAAFRAALAALPAVTGHYKVVADARAAKDSTAQYLAEATTALAAAIAKSAIATALATAAAENVGYDEEQTARFSLITAGVDAGTGVAYTLSGVSASDLVSGSLTGTAEVSATGTTIISLPLTADSLTEGEETLTITLDDYQDKSASVIVNDTSKTTVTETNEYRTTILADENILGPNPTLIKGINENITTTDGIITDHFFLYVGNRYEYSSIDSLLTVITRDDEFTNEFSQEISDYSATLADMTYSDAIKIVGVSGIDDWLIKVAGDDGSYVY